MKKPAPFGKYYLLERINVGGMAEVFRAKAFGVEGFERLVAVKRILPNIAEDKEFIRMFIEEAKLAVQLNHANIAQIFDLGVVDTSYYIALEHVHGRDLRGIFDRCRNGGEAMPVAQACFVVMKMCEGLDYAHNKRDQSGRELALVHRDVSPQNVLVSFEGEVKVIDFGIAKAAGKGSKTQAGILKGKFGYMSPEQVRGLPIDRRSDVFSCGIVLYELLTGERLFVGESDFSTLEKVRNVEILPPSTYNRKIPDELERIVLKALAKDVDDRYQNAIDLHDELQAFVYTAGEFYSRKDLAGWMKKMFGKEIDEETAKLETYRQIKPPAPIVPDVVPPPTPAVARTTTGSNRVVAPPTRRSSSGASGNKPPPPPPAGRLSGQMPAIAPPPAPGKATPRAAKDDAGLAWDDDELETQIYDNPDDDPKRGGKGSKSLPKITTPDPDTATPVTSPAATIRGMAAAPAGDIPSLAGAAGATASQTMTGPAPDLSSLVSTAKGWESGGAPSPAATLAGAGPTPAAPPAPVTPLANGSQKVPSPLAPEPAFTFGGRDLSRDSRDSRDSHTFDPMASFGAGITARKQSSGKGPLLIAIGAVAAVSIGAAIILATRDSGPKPTPPAPPIASTTGSGGSAEPPPAVGDQDTGFDLYVTPGGIASWKLDGEGRTDRLPSRIRGITPGVHTVQIDPPPGFLSQSEQVTVEQGKAPKVEIALSPIQGIVGVFESTPPGATVSLIVDGKRQLLGPAPAKAPLDPRLSYQVLFEKSGYVSVNRPLVISGDPEQKVVVPLEKAGAGVAIAPDTTKPDTVKVPTNGGSGPITKPDTTKPDTTKPDTTKPDTTKPDTTKPDTTKPDVVVDTRPKGQGTLMLGSKPSCEIYIDGAATGLHTPQRAIKLAAGKHRVTLVNNEFGIRESFSVDITPDATEKAIKDYSDKLPQ